MGKLIYDLEDFQKAAVQYRGDLLRMPIEGLEKTLQYMTLRPGITYEQIVGTITASAELAPYKAGRRSDVTLDAVLRPLRTYFGSVNADFEPNAEISTLLGHRASQAMGDALATTPQAYEVLANVAKSVSGKLNGAIWTAKRDDAGTTTATLFNGFDTITDDEVNAGKISTGNGNLLELGEAITPANAVDVAKQILYSLSDELRDEQCYLFCSRDFADKYNEGYRLTHAGINYYNEYNQTVVEGSEGNLILAPMSAKKNSKYFQVSPKRNMLVGCDQMSDAESVRVKEYAPDVLTFMLRMFFGVQFESIDAKRFKAIKLFSE